MSEFCEFCGIERGQSHARSSCTACPECRDGKHQNCAGFAYDADDNETDCECKENRHA